MMLLAPKTFSKCAFISMRLLRCKNIAVAHYSFCF